jgi:hypothetical protein
MRREIGPEEYELQVQTPVGWRKIAVYNDFNDAIPACHRTSMSQKCSSRVVERLIVDTLGTEPQYREEVVAERHYNIRDDPDENWRDDIDELAEQYEFRWQEVGF